MDDGGVVGHLRQVRRRMARQGASTDQIAAALIAEFDVNPRVAFRHALGLTQAQVAERYNQRWPGPVPKTRKEISYWECWPGPGRATSSSSARAPSYEDLARLAALYGCLVDDLLFGPRRDTTPPATTVSYPVITDLLSRLQGADYAENVDSGGTGNGAAAGAIVTLHAAIGEGSIIVRLSRRQFGELLAAGGLAALLPDALASVAHADTGDGVATWRRTLTAHQAGHHLLAPSDHITALTQALAGMAAAREQAPATVRRRLRQVQAEYAEHISWLYRETGDLASCWQWADRATTWALEAGDSAMATYMMLRRANVALDQGDHERAGDLAQAALHADWAIPPALRAVAHLYQARAQAAVGTVASDQLDRADELLADGHRPNAPVYLRFYTPQFGELQRATCYMTAGKPSRAVTILQARLTGQPGTHHRDRAVHLARLGAAHAADRVPDAAAIAGLGALTEARRAGSVTTLGELRRLDDTLTAAWPRQPKVREFHQTLLAAHPAERRAT